MYACICRGITEAEVRDVGRAGVVSPSGLIAVLGLDDDGCCGQCVGRIGEFVVLALEGGARPGDPARMLASTVATGASRGCQPPILQQVAARG